MSRIVGRVVVGVSGSPESLHALRHAVELARQYETTLIAVNAQRVAERASHVWQHAAALVIRNAFEEGLGGLPKDVECVLLAAPGDPGPALLGVADRTNDFLVLGAARRTDGEPAEPVDDAASEPLPARRQLLRFLRPATDPETSGATAVAAYCIAGAVCSVLSVPPPPLAARARAYSRLPR